MAKPSSGGSTPKRTGKKRPDFEPGSNTAMKNALDAALKRLGDPVVEYRQRRNQIVKRKLPPKDG